MFGSSFVVDTVSSAADWQAELARSITDSAELCRLLDLPPETAWQAAAEGLPVLVPRTFLRRMRRGDPRDPLLLQVLPQGAELLPAAGFTCDPLGEAEQSTTPGLLWKYTGRILILTTPACGVHCRFCFRQHFPFERGSSSPLSAWWPALKKIASEPSIREVILSGGDPLMLPDEELESLVEKLGKISHVRRLRIHSRLPVMIPQRVTDDLLRLLSGGRQAPVMVVHVNHPAEIDAEVAGTLTRLVDAGIPTLSQGVLLRGINDRADALAELYERLVELRVMPYYLHQLDPVAGAAHFEVPVEQGIDLIHQLRGRLPGYAVPRYVRETREGPSKEILA
jgi:L-lysine 2,3-aminomutase